MDVRRPVLSARAWPKTSDSFAPGAQRQANRDDQFGATGQLLPDRLAGVEPHTYYVITDHLGTPQMLTDQNQAVVWQTEQTPFGEITQTTGNLIQPLRFPGQYADPETGYSYNYFRDYDPTLGRYVQSDPIGLEGGFNTYGYVLQNPLSHSDFYGLDLPDGAHLMCNSRGVSPECLRNSGVGGGGRNGRQQASTNRAESVGCSSGPRGGTYILTDPGTGAVRRTGRTNDLDRRRN